MNPSICEGLDVHKMGMGGQFLYFRLSYCIINIYLRDFWYHQVQDEFWLEVSSVRWLFRKGSFKCSIIIPKIFLTNSNYTLLPYAQNMTSEREFQSVRKFSISISLMSPAKVCRFTTQLSCHKSATATVS